MTILYVETYDKDIDHGIWGLKTPDIRIEQSLRKELGSPSQITVYLELGTAALNFVAAVLMLIAAREKGKPRTTKTIVRLRKSEVDLKALVARYEESIQVEVQEEDGE